MDWGSWSPSHTILVLFIIAGFAGQVAVYFYRTAQNNKKIERLEDRMDKRFSEMLTMIDKRIGEVNQRLSDMDANIRQLNQNHIDHLNRHEGN